MKRAVTITLIIAILFTFTACGKKKDDGTYTGSSSSSSDAPLSPEQNTKNLFEDNQKKWLPLKEGDNVEKYKFPEEKEFNVIRFKEDGKKVDNIKVEAMINGSLVEIYNQDEMGVRAGVIDTVKTSEVQVTITTDKLDAKVDSITFEKVEPFTREKPFRVATYINGPYDAEKVKGLDGRIATSTDLIMFTYKNFDEQGNIVGSEVKADGVDVIKNDIESLKKAFERMNVKPRILLCLGTCIQTGEPKKLCFTTPDRRANFVKQAMELVEKYKVDGLDLDFEYPETKEQWDGYSAIMIELSAALKPLGKQLSVALPPWGVGFSKEAIAAIDQVQIMNYDLFDDKQRHAPFSVSKSSVTYFTNQGFKLEQLNPGLATYGREMDKNAKTERWLTYGNVLAQNPDKITKDTNSFDNSYMTGKTLNRDKVFNAIETGCGGVMIFRYGCDAPFDNKLSITRGVSEIISQFVK
ncbi:MAG: glycosyl hydrolase family 18 protein [Clostridia bacterium]